MMNHNKLGILTTEGSSWIVKKGAPIPFLEKTAPSIVISVKEKGQYPTEFQFSALLEILEKPKCFKEEFENIVYPELVDIIDDYFFDKEIEISKSIDIWEVITGIYSIWVHHDSMVTISFNLYFEDEHELSVSFYNGIIVEICMG